MSIKNPRGPIYGAVGAAAAIAVCLGAVVLSPAVSRGTSSHTTAVLARDQAPLARHQHRADGMTFLQRLEAQGGDCTLTVPADPLTAQGLATPYVLDNGPNTTGCTMANAANLGAFVQATILEPGGKLAVYDPLVITAGTTPAAVPPVPAIPAGSVVTIDTGFNGNILFLRGPGAGFFNQGLPGSPFGQVAAANGPAFFFAARGAAIPALGTAADGMPCPTVRDFSLVDQDQSDNVTAVYVVNGDGQTALPGSGVTGTTVGNGSDNRLLTHFVDPALNCTPFEATSLSSPGTTEPSQALDELQARADQGSPAALVPPNDPMTTVGADIDIIPNDFPVAGNLSVFKTDAYRLNVGQPLMFFNPVQAATAYCKNLQAIGAPRLALDAKFETGPSPAAGMTLTAFLAQRFAASVSLLNCKLFNPGSAAPAAAPAVTPTPVPTPTDTPAVTAPDTAAPATTDPPAAAPATDPSATDGP